MTNEEIEKKAALLSQGIAESLYLPIGKNVRPLRETIAQAIREAKAEAYEEATTVMDGKCACESDSHEHDCAALYAQDIRALKDSLVAESVAS